MAAHIKPGLFTFLRDLARNNNRDWFQANKERYEAQVREPLLKFIADFGEILPEISPHYLADARKVGGSLFRIHRDVRFAKDKSPYKTAAGIHFRHERARDVHAPGYYLHLEPGEIFMGVGIWHPDREALAMIRDAVAADDGADWLRAISNPDFQTTFALDGDSLKRPPRGYDPDHPMIEDLRRTDFIGVTDLTQKQVCAADFLDSFHQYCRKSASFMQFLTRALGLPW